MVGQGHFGGFEEEKLFSQVDSIHQDLVIIPWDRETEYVVLTFYSKKLEAGFKDYNNEIKVKTNVGDNLIKAVEDFEEEILHYYNF